MNHLYNTKQHFQTIVDQQRIAHYRLTKDQTTRTLPERNNYERKLQPVPASDVELPKLPLVRLRETEDKIVVDLGKRWVLIGEIAQSPGKVILLNIQDGSVEVNYMAEELEIVPPTELS